MDWNLIKEFIQPELLIIVVFLIAAGMFLKKAPWFKAEWTIPFVLWGLEIIFVILWFGVVDGKGFTTVIFVNGIVQGTLVAAVAVFGNQLFKQFTDKRIVDNEHLYVQASRWLYETRYPKSI